MTSPTTRKTKTASLKKSQISNSPTFADHFSELRSRIGSIFVVFILGSIIGYFFNQQILDLLISPLNQPVFYTSPSGGFEFVFQIALFVGFILSLPIFVYHTVRFVEPALPKKYPNLILSILSASSILLILGMTFAYFVSLPAALYFLNKFSGDQVQSLISTNEYFSFVTRYLVGFGLVFQLPLVLLAVNTVHKLSIKSLLQWERWVILISFILAAILTPTPDIFNQLIMALPLIVLYQITIFLIWIVNKSS